MINTATQNQATNQPPKLLDQVVAKMRVKHYSLRTEKSYIDWIKRYIWYFDKTKRGCLTGSCKGLLMCMAYNLKRGVAIGRDLQTS